MAITNSKLPVMPREKMGMRPAMPAKGMPMKASMGKAMGKVAKPLRAMPAKAKKGGMKATKMGVGMGKGKGLVMRKKKGGMY